MITELAVDVAVFVREKGFSRFPHETQALFKVVGVADLAAWTTCRTEFVEIAPTTVKKLLTGSGKASKEEVATALKKQIGRQDYATNDESDVSIRARPVRKRARAPAHQNVSVGAPENVAYRSLEIKGFASGYATLDTQFPICSPAAKPNMDRPCPACRTTYDFAGVSNCSPFGSPFATLFG